MNMIKMSILFCVVAGLAAGCVNLHGTHDYDRPVKGGYKYDPKDFSPLPSEPHKGPGYSPATNSSAASSRAVRDVPPVPGDGLPGESGVSERRAEGQPTGSQRYSRLETSATPAPRYVTVSWENEFNELAAVLVTGLQGSPDRRAWSVITNLPYATRCEVSFVPRSAPEYYRAFWGWRR